MIFCAESKQNGIWFDHTYEADNADHAQYIANQNGWTFLGEVVIDADEELYAQMEKQLYDPVIH